MALQPQQWQEIYMYYISLASSTPPLSPEEILKCISFRLESFDLPADITPRIASYLCDRFTAHEFVPIYDDPIRLGEDPTDNPVAYLSQQDLEYIEKNIIPDPDATYESVRLLLAYLIFARLNPHHSNWIKCDKKDKTTILYLASLSALPVSRQENLIQLLHKKFSLNMRVVGSTQPIPCFQIPWQADQDPVNTEHNQLFTIGPLTPKTISDLAATLINKKEDNSHD